ncbi:MAG: hypothetical protein AUK48_15875 [Oscillatoriales cyanobacterium CG2_30_44_21]|nr:MAG: hypothetical protein AUK48_15875 [Oscillatoriales cyanobacterium CG2_30_44_21]
MNFIPAIAIAVDPYSTRLLAAVQNKLQQRYPQIAALIQFRALVASEGKLSEDLDAYACKDFDLISDRLHKSLDDRQVIETLQQESIALLRSGGDPQIIAAAEQAGINVSPRRRIYCFATTAYPACRDTIPSYADLLRFLLNSLFLGQSNSLELIALLPSLFENEAEQACADTYGFFKVLDHHLSESRRRNRPMLFDNHWLIDRTNSERIQMPFLEIGLDAYAEIISTFLMREPDALGIAVGDTVINEKVAAFSSFGCSEVIFPINEIIKRLYLTLARDILDSAFLAEFEKNRENYRRLLLDVKAFVLQQSFSEAFDEIEQPRGKRIWQDFSPTISEPSLGLTQNYVDNLDNQKQIFRDQRLLGFKRVAEESSSLAKTKINQLLENEVTQQSDSLNSGLDQVSQFLAVLVDSTITGNVDILGEEPQNLITNGRKLALKLDNTLGVVINREASEKCLQRIAELRIEIASLEDAEKNLFFTEPIAKSITDNWQSQIDSKAQNTPNDDANQDVEPLNDQEEVEEISLGQKVLLKRAEFLEVWQQLQVAIESEEFAARRNRQTAIADKEEKLRQDIDRAEKDLYAKEKDWERCKERLEDALERKRNFLLLYLVVYLGGIALITGLIAIAAAIAGFLGAIGGLIWLISGIAVAVWLVLFIKNLIAVSEEVKQATTQLKNSQRSFKAAATTLRRNHNEQLKFEFDLYLQRIRADVADVAITSAQRWAANLNRTLDWLRELRIHFERQIQSIDIPESVIRSSIISTQDIDLIYAKLFPDIERTADSFTDREILRSQVLAMNSNLFQSKIADYAQEKFEHLSRYSLMDVLNGHSEFLLSNDADVILRKFYRVSQPLVQLFHTDMDRITTNAQDLTLWINNDGSDEIVNSLRQLRPTITTYESADRHSLTLLGRHMGFPLYFLSSIEFYRLC